MNLYAEYNYAIKKLAVLSTQGLVDNSFFCEGCWHWPGHALWASDGGRNQLGKDYVASFPDPVISKLLAQAPSLSYMYLDGLPPG